MNLESLKEQLLDRLMAIWERIRDSDLYIQGREKYQNLSPSMQKIVMWFGVAFAALFVLLIPYTFISSSSESIETFENNVNLVRDYYRVQRELATTPMVPETPQSSEISSMVQNVLGQSNLSAEQISGPREITPEREAGNALQPTGISEHGIEITLLKLNVRQVSEIGEKLSQLGRGLHLTALDMKASAQNDHYFDVIFRVTGYSVPGSAPSSSKQDAEEESAPSPSGTPPARGKPPGRGA